MKRNIFIEISIIVILLISILTLKYNPIYKIYKEKQIIKNNINFLNGVSTNGIDTLAIERYNRLQTPVENLNHYDITEIVNKYIELVMLRKNNNGIKDKKHSYVGDIREFEKNSYTYGKDIKMKYDNDIKYYIENLNKDYTEELLIFELKNILDYEEKDGKIKWLVNDVQERNIELPLNCYLKYTPYSRVLNTEFSEVVDILFKDKHKADINKDINTVIINYKTKEGLIKNIETELRKSMENGKIYYSCSPRSILVLKGDNLAQIELHSHDIDKAHEKRIKEIEAYENEVMRIDLE